MITLTLHEATESEDDLKADTSAPSKVKDQTLANNILIPQIMVTECDVDSPKVKWRPPPLVISDSNFDNFPPPSDEQQEQLPKNAIQDTMSKPDFQIELKDVHINPTKASMVR